MKSNRVPLAVSEIVDRFEVRWNRLLVNDALTFDEAFDLWHPPARPVGRREQFVEGGTAPSLLLVVTTHNRAGACERLIESLVGALTKVPDERAHLLVLDDASTEDYSGVERLLAEKLEGNDTLLRARTNLGKRGFWKIYQTAFYVAQSLRPARTVFLQDDVNIDTNFLVHALGVWASIHDPTKQVLYLFTERGDQPEGRWVRFSRVEYPGRPYRLTQWFDLPAFLVGADFFELLGHRVFPIHPNRWKRQPTVSSGVGEQLTHRLWRRGNVYQVTEPIVFHGAEASRLNPEARQVHRLDNRL